MSDAALLLLIFDAPDPVAEPEDYDAYALALAVLDESDAATVGHLLSLVRRSPVNSSMRTPAPPSTLCGTETPLATPEAREAALDAVREAKGRRAIRPADTVAGAADDIAAFLVVPAWAEGETAASVAADTLCTVHGLDAAAHPFAWMLYTEGARCLGFGGPVPVPHLDGLGGGETSRAALA